MSMHSPYQLLRRMHVSEKSSMLSQQHNQYVLEVSRYATKHQIRRAVKNLFNVDVRTVRVVNTPGKRLRNRWGAGQRNHGRKAYVSLMPGQHIDMGESST